MLNTLANNLFLLLAYHFKPIAVILCLLYHGHVLRIILKNSPIVSFVCVS